MIFCQSQHSYQNQKLRIMQYCYLTYRPYPKFKGFLFVWFPATSPMDRVSNILHPAVSGNEWTMVEKLFPKGKPKRVVNGFWAAKPTDDHLLHLQKQKLQELSQRIPTVNKIPRWCRFTARFKNHYLGNRYDQTQTQHFLKSCFLDLSFTRQGGKALHARGLGTDGSDLGHALAERTI